MKITKVYTRHGDQGKTSLVGGQRVSKASKRLEAYGTVDELSSNLGLLAAMLQEGYEYEIIIRIQNCLFNVCTNLATNQDETPLYPSAHLPEGEIAFLEQEVDAIMDMLPEPEVPARPPRLMSAGQSADVLNVVLWRCLKRPQCRQKYSNM